MVDTFMNPFRPPVKPAAPPPQTDLRWFNEYMSKAEAHTSEDFVKALGKLNGFTPADLEANRGGTISRGQWWRLLRRAFRPAYVSLKVFASLMLTIYVIDAVFPWIGRFILAKKVGLSMGSVFGGAGISLVFGILETTKMTVQVALDLFAGRAFAQNGRIAPSSEERPAEGMGRLYGQKETAYHYVIRDQYYEVDLDSHQVLDRHFEGYLPLVTVYFAPRSKLMLSVEPISTLTEDTYVVANEDPPRGEKR